MTGAAKLHKSDFNGNSFEQTFSHIVEAFGIDGINLPVLLLDGDARMLAANAKACELLSRKQSEISGFLLGEVIGCAHALELGNCGETFRCTSCAMRLAVTYTMVTGQECHEVPVYPDTDPVRGDKTNSFAISTKKVFNYVFLTIHKLTGDTSSSQ
jgi:PAS domain-containing protein